MITCYKCGAVLPEGWQRLTHTDREALKRAFGIKPECSTCLEKKHLEEFWRKRA